MSVSRRSYSTDLTDAEWQILEPLLPGEKPGGRHRLYPLREIINALRYLLRAGCEPVVRGGYCRTIFRTGEPFINISKSGSKTARGSKFTIICTNNCARKCRARNNHRQLLLIHNR